MVEECSSAKRAYLLAELFMVVVTTQVCLLVLGRQPSTGTGVVGLLYRLLEWRVAFLSNGT